MLKSIRVLTVVSIFAAQSVMAGDVDLTSGKFTVNERGFATQLLIAKNKAPRSSISSSTAAFCRDQPC
jgi:hypothetical protein